MDRKFLAVALVFVGMMLGSQRLLADEAGARFAGALFSIGGRSTDDWIRNSSFFGPDVTDEWWKSDSSSTISIPIWPGRRIKVVLRESFVRREGLLLDEELGIRHFKLAPRITKHYRPMKDDISWSSQTSKHGLRLVIGAGQDRTPLSYRDRLMVGAELGHPVSNETYNFVIIRVAFDLSR